MPPERKSFGWSLPTVDSASSVCRRFALRGAAGARPSERVALLLAERPNGKRFWAFLHARDLEVP